MEANLISFQNVSNGKNIVEKRIYLKRFQAAKKI